MSLRTLFTEHPRSVGETYWQHLGQAARFGGRMMVGGAVCLLHALLPFLWRDYASNVVCALHTKMSGRQERARPPQPAG